MEKSSKRGKIPQSDWPLIMARYEAGETLASIARTYDCSPPAISYVVSRSRARHPGVEAPAPLLSSAVATEPQLIKAASPESRAGAADPEPNPPRAAAPPVDTAQPAPSAPRPARHDELGSREINGYAGNSVDGRAPHPTAAPARIAAPPHRAPDAPSPPAAGNGDPRRILHLSLGAPAHDDSAKQPAELHQPEHHRVDGHHQEPAPQRAPHTQPQSAAGHPGTPPPRGPYPASAPDFGDHGRAEAVAPSSHGAGRGNGEDAHRHEGGGSFIDKELRARVDSDIAAFLAAFDAALVQDSQESRSALREATDRLLRAGARTRIELERLEARVPLPPRDNSGRETAWRHR